MARGWESKAIEEQQAERERGDAPKRPLTPGELARRERRGALALALARARADLEAARSAGHRAMLEGAIRDLERQLADDEPARGTTR